MEVSMTHVLREKIRTCIKNGVDISDLIDGVSIKNENLEGAIIRKFIRKDSDISGGNFARVIFGQKNSSSVNIMIVTTNLQNCNFKDAIFEGKSFIRSCNARNCNFIGSDFSNVDYQHTNFEGSTFCDAIIRVSPTAGIGCKFPKETFDLLTKHWL